MADGHDTDADESTEEYDPRYLQGIEYFNDCEFFEAHDIWEELWADVQGTPEGSSRRFYQGLIQVAVCLHHFGNGNIRGAKKLYHSCRGYLTDYEPFHGGVDVTELLGQLKVCCQEILDSQEEFPKIEIEPETIPEIHLRSQA